MNLNIKKNHMKKNTLLITMILLVVFVLSTTSNAQVAINTDASSPDASAMLDITSGSKGLLIPRVVLTPDLADTEDPVFNPATGLLVFNSGSNQEEGFYYWDGVKWTKVSFTGELFGLSQLGEIYENNGFATPSVIDLTVNTTWYGWITATQGEIFGDVTTDVTNLTADQIIIGDDGLYEISLASSFAGASTNFQLTVTVWHTPSGGSATETKIEFLTKIGSTGDIASGSANGFLNLLAGDKLDVRFKAEQNNNDLEIYTLNLVCNKIAD